jgi:hypothetical protein
MDTVSTLTTVKQPKFDPNIRTKIPKNNYPSKANSHRNNLAVLQEPTLKKLKSSKSSRNGSSSTLKNPTMKAKTSKKSIGNKENIEKKKINNR